MASLNRVLLAGNLTRDPEVGYTSTGVARSDLSLAVDRTYLSEGQSKKETCFIGVVVWGRQAEVCREYLSKGSPVLIEGFLQFVPAAPESGEKNSRHLVRADRVQFLSRPRGEVGDAPARTGAPGQPGQPGDGTAAPAPAAVGVPPAPGAANDDDLPF